VRAIERVGHLDRILQRELNREGPAYESVRQRFAFEILHHEEIEPILVPDVVQRADVRVIEARDGARFALQPLAQLGVVGDVSGSTLSATMRSSRVSRPL